MVEIRLPAEIKSIGKAHDFVNACLEKTGCSMHAKMHIEIALDELISNVAQYAYETGTGDVTIGVEMLNDPKRVVITLTDSGIPYNPLEKEDPDITLSAEKRKIGGLGIFIVKKYMDALFYTYQNKHNILTLVKKIDEESDRVLE